MRAGGWGFRVQGSGFRVDDLGFRFKGLGFRLQGVGCRVDHRRVIADRASKSRLVARQRERDALADPGPERAHHHLPRQSKKGSSKVNFPSRQWFSNVKTASGGGLE